MPYLQQPSGLTGHKIFAGMNLKYPYGVLGGRKEIATPSAGPASVNSVPLINPKTFKGDLLPQAPFIEIPNISDGNGPSTGSPAPGSLTGGQAAVASATEAQNAVDFGKKAAGVGLGMAAPDVAATIGKATKSVPAAITSYGLMSALSYGHPVLGIANLGFSAAAQAMANADMADAVDSGDIGPDMAGVASSLTPSNTTPSDDLANIGFETLGSKVNKAIQGMHKAKNAPLGFLGSKIANAESFGEPFSEESVMDNMAREALTPGSTADIGKLGMAQYSALDAEQNTYSTPEGYSAHQRGTDPAGLAPTAEEANEAANNAAAAQQAADDAEQNSLGPDSDVDGGFFSGIAGGSDPSSGSTGVAGGSDPSSGSTGVAGGSDPSSGDMGGW